jgi:hypothetical protein
MGDRVFTIRSVSLALGVITIPTLPALAEMRADETNGSVPGLHLLATSTNRDIDFFVAAAGIRVRASLPSTLAGRRQSDAHYARTLCAI